MLGCHQSLLEIYKKDVIIPSLKEGHLLLILLLVIQRLLWNVLKIACIHNQATMSALIIHYSFFVIY